MGVLDRLTGGKGVISGITAPPKKKRQIQAEVALTAKMSQLRVQQARIQQQKALANTYLQVFSSGIADPSWLPDQDVTSRDFKPDQNIRFKIGDRTILELTPEGFNYKGEMIKDAGQAHRIFIAVMTRMRLKG